MYLFEEMKKANVTAKAWKEFYQLDDDQRIDILHELVYDYLLHDFSDNAGNYNFEKHFEIIRSVYNAIDEDAIDGQYLTYKYIHDCRLKGRAIKDIYLPQLFWFLEVRNDQNLILM